MSAIINSEFDDAELEGKLTIKQLRFVNEYMVDSNGTQAAIRAGYSEHSATVQASDLLMLPKVKAAILERLEHAAAAASVTAEMVIAELRNIATADVSELQELIVRPCRACWPEGLKLEDPNPLCQLPLIGEYGVNRGGCGGAGVEIVKRTPTKKLSRRASRLISAMRQKKDGSVEVDLRSQDKALELLGRARGVFKDVKEISGPGGSPVPLAAYQSGMAKQMSDEEIEARLAEIRGTSGGTSKLIEGNPQDVK